MRISRCDLSFGEKNQILEPPLKRLASSKKSQKDQYFLFYYLRIFSTLQGIKKPRGICRISMLYLVGRKTMKSTQALMSRLASNKVSFGLLLKLTLILITVPPVMTKWFGPFVSYFVTSGFANPYTEFFKQGQLESFPYSSIMLWVFSFPAALVQWFAPGLVSQWPEVLQLLPRLTLILADYVVFRGLVALLPAHRSRLIYFWWLNPLVIYICYVHGQLDILPTAALVASLVFLLRGQDLVSFVLLALGMAMKMHVAAVLPFYVMFIYFRRFSWQRALGLLGLSLGLFALLQIPYWSEGYIHMVLLEKKSQRLFSLAFPFDAEGKAFLFAPAVILFLFFRFASLKTTNRDTLMLVLGLLYAAMVAVVPPTPGWFLWSMPFLVYFFVKYREASRLSFYSLLGLYVAYQVIDRYSDVPAVFAPLLPRVDLSTTAYGYLASRGLDAQKIENLAFTALESALVMNIFWVYRVGVSSSNLARRLKQNFRIGICGDSGSGKSTATESLVALFGVQDALVVAGDDLHKWERGHENWKTRTHLDPKSNRLHDDVEQAERLMVGQNVKRTFYDHGTGRFTPKQPIESKPFIIFQGLHTFFLSRMRDMMHVKIFIDPDKTLRYVWKIKRDMAYRGYSKDQVLQQLERRETDAVKYIETQKAHADIIIRYLPVNPNQTMEEMLAMSEVPVKLRIVMNADLNIESLVGCLQETCTIASDYWYEPEIGRLVFECEGQVDAETIELMASRLVVSHQELVGTNSKWKDGYDGVVQLLILMYLKHFYAEGQN